MRSRLDRWRTLSADERWLLAGLFVLLPAIGIALRMLGFRRTCRLLGCVPDTASTHIAVDEHGHALATRIGVVVNIAARRGPYGATCLPRSLALLWVLRRRALPASLRIGVSKGDADARIRAHAWIVLAGRPIGDDPAVGGEFAAYPALDCRLARPLRTA